MTGARLKEAGVTDVRIVEKGGDFGGTWYWNRYPGAQCDTASLIYMPLLEETGHMPSEKYAHAPEILEHCQRIGKHFGLYDDALFHTEVQDLEWDDERSRWIVRTDRGDAFTAQFLAMGTGPLHVPKLPGIPGIDDFPGHSFHTSRWDYAYTGGDPYGAPLDGLADKRVAIIGTGATSVQAVPHLAGACAELLRLPAHAVLGRRPRQRARWTPSGSPRSPPRAGSGAGWRTSPPPRPAPGDGEDLVMDGWTDLARRMRERVHVAAAGAADPRRHAGGDGGRGLREDGGDPRPGRRRRGRSGDRRGAQGLVPAAVQAAVLPRRVPRRLQPAAARTWCTPTARASSGSPRPASSPTAASTRSTASSTPRASRWAPSTPAGPATT